MSIMALCTDCKTTAIMRSVEETPRLLCADHFITYFEQKVRDTISRFSLFTHDDRIAVACSGGKDSVTVLLLLHSWGYKVTALLIDEGIKGYRDATKEELSAICATAGIPLQTLPFKELFGKDLDDVVVAQPSKSACTTCGVWRRFALQRGSNGFDVLVTGHNLDDEAQAVMMNILSGQTALLTRMGPRSEGSKVFLPRAKPLYLCAEKEVRIYTYLQEYPITYHECPYARAAFREKFSSGLNRIEAQMPGAKWRILNSFLQLKPSLPLLPSTMQFCIRCNEPSSAQMCKACQLQKVHA